jgi:hypothetical protein
MHKASLLILVLTGCAIGPASALECLAPGTTIQWATDQCLLQTGSKDSRSRAMQTCLRKADTIRQPCEWNIEYKRDYCKLLIRKRRFRGTVKVCLADPAEIGPTVRKAVQECLLLPGNKPQNCTLDYRPHRKGGA